MSKPQVVADAAPGAKRSRAPLMILFLTVFIDLLGFGIVIPFLPLYAERMHVGAAGLKRLIGRPVQTSRQVVRRYGPTDRARGTLLEWEEIAADEIKPAEGPRFDGPVAVLTSAATFSAAEDFLVAWKNSGRGAIIGSASGGSTGQPLNFSLPGGGSARVCTKRDTFPDGREWVGIGIQPDIEVHPDIADLVVGRDIVVERALAYLKNKH
jgi:hypothetical protein